MTAALTSVLAAGMRERNFVCPFVGLDGGGNFYAPTLAGALAAGFRGESVDNPGDALHSTQTIINYRVQSIN